MSFERFGSSDVYIFEHVAGYIECCGCSLIKGEDKNDWFVKLSTPRAALDHLDSHEVAGDDIGGARKRIEKEYKNLDAAIEPYIASEKAWPPTRFRDAGNGE
jgi:hypothetical protein